MFFSLFPLLNVKITLPVLKELNREREFGGLF